MVNVLFWKLDGSIMYPNPLQINVGDFRTQESYYPDGFEHVSSFLYLFIYLFHPMETVLRVPGESSGVN